MEPKSHGRNFICPDLHLELLLIVIYETSTEVQKFEIRKHGKQC